MADGYALALQKALVGALKADAGASTIVGGRIYDQPPQDAVRPFIRIGGIQPRPLRTDGKSAGSITFAVEAHSRPSKSGRVEATRCAEAVVKALDEAALTVTGFTLVQLQWITQEVTQDSDGKSYTAVIAFSAILDG
ncbi:MULTISPECIES: DUF3168 domain-containing protein [unclassified Sulfitobacter]|jgi:hypothetical protein|uniref:DUF3168 domain-containing protein n=1 Tax=unclassified Sulfitobacter TaxID=196795 RepID=UPI0007C2B1D7|nr:MULTISPECIES: DUF3168 domain-containing protein [unclassified Sulfitobacter]KZY05269.1 hypothetical protein A3721_15170 [Sulfitobacter sp. HI0023]KZY26835.1 hypothetical protein A3728_14795 [Sulfitobacter sp. HI0040]KZZ62438.1 hypothetical protein A3764_06270 [Sulfitobacter sp. HI0129]